MACRGIPESNAGLAGMIVGQSHREHLAVRAVGQAQDDLALSERPADLPAGGRIPEPDQSIVIARGQDLAVGVECQGRDVVGVRHRREPQPARARVPESHLAGETAVRVASGREASAVGTEGERSDDPAGVMRGGPSQGATGRGIGESDQFPSRRHPWPARWRFAHPPADPPRRDASHASAGWAPIPVVDTRLSVPPAETGSASAEICHDWTAWSRPKVIRVRPSG